MRSSLAKIASRGWKLVRTHYALGFTALILVGAAVIGSGVLSDSAWRRPARELGSGREAVTAVTASVPPPLVVTYYLVSSPEHAAGLNALEDQMVQREWLRKWTYEVRVARSDEEAEVAIREIAASNTGSTGATIVVEDLRRQ